MTYEFGPDPRAVLGVLHEVIYGIGRTMTAAGEFPTESVDALALLVRSTADYESRVEVGRG